LAPRAGHAGGGGTKGVGWGGATQYLAAVYLNHNVLMIAN